MCIFLNILVDQRIKICYILYIETQLRRTIMQKYITIASSRDTKIWFSSKESFDTLIARQKMEITKLKEEIKNHEKVLNEMIEAGEKIEW